MHRPFRRITALLSILGVMAALGGCSQDIASYDDLARTGQLEKTTRAEYSSLLSAVTKLQAASADSTMVAGAAGATDQAVERLADFPTTVDSRLAFDAISYAAAELAASPGMSSAPVRGFWEAGLLAPLFSTARGYIAVNAPNPSAHLQIVKGLQRAMGEHATEAMLRDCMPIVGVIPSNDVLAYCAADTLVFKRIHDLILYARSLQETDPPLWLLSGNWIMGIEYPDAPPIFILLSPHIASGVAYLAFQEYRSGDFYAKVFNDPIPTDQSAWDDWLVRANAVIEDLSFDDDLARRIARSDFPPEEAHYFYSDYIVRSQADSVNREIKLSFVRNRARESEFQYTGRDSIAVVFDEEDIVAPDGPVTTIPSDRVIGNSMIGGRAIPGQSLTGFAHLMATGPRDTTVVARYREQLVESLRSPEVRFEGADPEISVEVVEPPGN